MASAKCVTGTESDITCELDHFIKNGFQSFVEATKTANDLPKSHEFEYYKTLPSFSATLKTDGDCLLHLVNKILNENGIASNMKSSSLAAKEELIGEANDVILDRAIVAIDEMNGLKSIPSAPLIQTVSADISINGSWNRINKFTVSEGINEIPKLNARSIHLLTAKYIVRPQTYFKDQVDNGNLNPWKPRILEKPNSLKPLALYLEPSEVNEGFDEWSHPYEFELEHFKVPDEFMLNIVEPCVVKSVDDTPLHEITTEEHLYELVDELRKHKEIAVDLEHHSYRSFQGITCLMQISTRDADYLIDTLQLRHKLYVLNEIFTKPSILKVFHGADMDIQWLQRDLCLYVVNMFDTHQAAKVLGFSGLSLAYLLTKYCSFLPNKKFQLADWRIRPLPQELKDYAREDTHYLIYVYEMLKRELYKQAHGEDNLLRAVFQASTRVCQTKYIKPRWTPDAHLSLCRRRKKMFDNRQLYALKEIYKWRDTIARDEDESTGYVLPNHMMLQIAEMLPREVQGILACCSPIPPLVRAQSLDLHHIILKAREQPLEKLIMQESNRRIVSKELVRLNIDSPLHCPHDLTKHSHNDNLPVLLNINASKDLIENVLPLEKATPSCAIFNDSVIRNPIDRNITALQFLGPFERYKLIRPLLHVEAEKLLVKKELETPANDSLIQVEAVTLPHHTSSTIENERELKEEHKPVTVSSNSFSAPLASTIPLEIAQPLITMPGSKKRKRNDSVDRFGTIMSDNGKPRKRPNNLSEIEHAAIATKKHKANNSPKQNMGNKNQTSASNKPSKHNQHSQRAFKKSARKEQRGNNKHNQDNATFSAESFDYSKVDYNQFAGGGRNVAHKQFESKHKGKKQNKRGGWSNRGGWSGYGTNESMTFKPSRGRRRT